MSGKPDKNRSCRSIISTSKSSLDSQIYTTDILNDDYLIKKFNCKPCRVELKKNVVFSSILGYKHMYYN